MAREEGGGGGGLIGIEWSGLANLSSIPSLIPLPSLFTILYSLPTNETWMETRDRERERGEGRWEREGSSTH